MQKINQLKMGKGSGWVFIEGIKMTNKHIKRFSTPFVIIGVQITIPMCYHFTPCTIYMCAYMLSLSVMSDSFVTPWTDPMDCSPDSSVHGISQSRILEWVAILFSRRSSWPKDWTQVSFIAGRFFTIWAPREVLIPTRMAVNQKDR